MQPRTPFNFDEDELREQLKEEVYGNHRQFGLILLARLFTTDPDDIEIDSGYSIPRGELLTTQTKKEALKRFDYVLKTQGRTGALYSLIGNLKALYPEDKEHKLLLFVELSECQYLLETKEPFAALMRGASFLEKALDERLPSSSNLAHLIQGASDEGVISNEQEKLAQFVRECRNDAGHNFWLETEYSYVVHEHAVHSQLTLFDSLLQRWYRNRWKQVTPELSSERCLRIVSDEFGLEWVSKDGLRQWNSNSMTERYDRRQ